MGSHGPRMDVKVLYTLESNPHHTMVARLGRAIPVDVIVPNISPLSPIHSNGHYPRQVRFGRIALKTCLSAVCMASPELLPDDKRDYIIYVVDPEETFRANQQTTPPRNAPRRSPSYRDQQDAGPSKPSSSPARPKESIFVGKGFFNWALEEQGDGETTVTGRLRSDGRRVRYENGREFEEDINILEVVIKLKESQARSKDRHFSLVRGISSHSTVESSSRDAHASNYSARSRRAPHRPELSLHSEPDYPVASQYDDESPPRRSSIRAPLPRRSGNTPDPLSRRSDNTPEVPVRVRPLSKSSTPIPLQQKTPATASEQTVNAVAAAAASAASNPQALQLLSILQSLQQRSSQSAPEPAQQAQLETLLQQVAMALATPPQPEPESAVDSTDAPEATGKKAAKRPRKGQRPAPSPSLDVDDSFDGSFSVATNNNADSFEEHKICYNCGVDSASTWRNLQLPAGSLVNHSAAERPPKNLDKLVSAEDPTNSSSSDDNAADSSNDIWVPRHADRIGPFETDAEAKWSACNPCGLYYVKWKVHRPEYVWKAEHARKRLTEHAVASEVTKREGTPADVDTTAAKRSRVSDEDAQPAIPAISAKQREADRLAFVNKKLLDRKPVWDEALGRYRSLRSIRENPSGNRPGRPKGSGKSDKAGRRASLGNSASNSPSLTQTNSNGNESTPPPKQAAEKPQKTPPQNKQHNFRAPLPPQAKPAQSNSRTVNFAQSSPVRPSMNAGQMQADVSYQFGGMGPLQSPSRDVRFRVPSYLMNSSPGTMMDTLMSETDFDFGSLPSVDMLQTPGTLLGNLGGRGLTPLRRSPRKNPHGTISGQNPYASPGNISPTFRMGSSRSNEVAMLSSNDSPVTRSRTKSGQDVLHPALFSSSDDLSNPDAKSSSTVTSPASPSLKTKGKKGTARARAGKGKAQVAPPAQAKVTTAARKASLTGKSRNLRATSAQSDDADEDDSEDNAPEARLVKGPYQSTGGSSREGSVGLPVCPRSPSLARSVRKFARNLSSASNSGSPASHWSMQNGRAKLASLDLPPSSPCFDHPTAESNAPRVDAWGRTSSMKEMFPTPSDLDWPSDASPEKDSKEKPTPPAPTSSTELVAQDRLQVPVVRRRPLPATVEDASSSVSGSSPASSEDSPEASDSNLFDLLEDPYGILAASGFGIDATGALASLDAGANNRASANGANAQMTPTSSSNQPTVSADAFSEVQLHQAKEFGLHLNEFQHSGSVGLATHAGGEAGASVQNSTPKPASIAPSPDDVPASPKVLLTPTLDASFLSSLPADLASIFASPKKPLPPRIVDILTSPRKPKTAPHSPSKTGVASSPSASGALVPYGFESTATEADFSALFNNPEIQAMLAEFGTSA